MASEPKLVAAKRSELGTAECRRLRRRGLVPGNIYGHKQQPVSISVSAESLDAMVHGHHKVVDVDIEGDVDKAMFREVQWDTFGIRIQHFDLLRIAADERVQVQVPIELRGVATGTMAGGVLEQPLRSLSVECLAFQIPESIPIRIGELGAGQSIHVSDVELPENMTVLTPADSLICRVVEQKGLEEEAEAEEIGPAEPEVIGRKEEPEGGEAEA